MLRLWKTSYMRPMPISAAAVASAIVHALIVVGWIRATLPPPPMPVDGVSNRTYYIPPPDRPTASRGSNESVRFIALGEGPGVGPGPARMDAQRAITPPTQSLSAGQALVDTSAMETLAAPELPGDSVFTVLEVDSAVVRSQTSAAPAYPLPLLSQRVEGFVIARYVVDTTGFADPDSFVVLRSTHDGFIQAVRDALPYMRFSPAKLGRLKVRQLVEQSFSFRITQALLAKP